jgi:predicted membrane protein
MRARDRSCRRSAGRDGLRAALTFGGALIIMGTGFLLGALGLLGPLAAWQVWPAILALMGLLKIALGRSVQHAVEGLILIGAGGAVGASYLGYFELHWDMVWPVLLIIAGVLVFFGAFRHTRRRARRRDEAAGGQPVGSAASFVEGEVLFGSREEKVTSLDFEGGDIRCTLGGFNLDLRDARIAGAEAVLTVKAVMGGIELYVPDDWEIVVRGNPTMGAFENKTRQRAMILGDDAPRLVIDGSVVMGGVEIKN